MRFTIVQRHLTDANGRPIRAPNAVTHDAVDGETIDDAVRLFVRENRAELIGDLLKMPGSHGIATVRTPTGVYTLDLAPANDPTPPDELT